MRNDVTAPTRSTAAAAAAPAAARLAGAAAPAVESLEGRVLFAGGTFWDRIVAAAAAMGIDVNLANEQVGLAPVANVRDERANGGDDDKDDDDDDDDRGEDDAGGEDDDDKGDDKNKDKDKDKGPKGRGGDTTAPAVEVRAADIDAAGRRPHTIGVVFTDEKKVRAATITKDAFSVVGPGGDALDVSSFYLMPAKDGDRVLAVLTVEAPGGRWDAADAGRYTVNVAGGQIADTKGNVSAGGSGTFDVNTATPDDAAPTAAVTAGNVTRGGGGAHAVTVTYRDDQGLDLSSINANDLAVRGPGGGDVEVASVNVTPSADRKSATAVYSLSAPGGSWDFSDNGTYAVTVRADQVRDAAGNALGAEAAGAFEVGVAAPPPVDPGYGGGDGGTGGNTGGGGGGGAVALPGFIGEAVASLPDGSIIVAGRTGQIDAGQPRAALQRYDATGRLDPTFGTRGSVVAPLGQNDAYFGIAVQGDRVVVAGTSNGEFMLARYDLAGRLDPTFGAGGMVFTDLGGADDTAYAIAVAPDGNLVAAGAAAGNVAFARYDADGRPDPNFGQGGRQLFDLGSETDVAGAVAVMADGRIVAVGSRTSNVAVVRLRANGEADTSFAGDGLQIIEDLAARGGTGPDRSQGMAVQPDGRILLAGTTSAGDFAVTRLAIDGNRDTAFGTGGSTSVDFGGDDDADAVILQDGGEILVLGTSLIAGDVKTAVAALGQNGSLITSFGNGGKLLLDATEPAATREMHVGDFVYRAYAAKQADGSVVVGNGGSAPRQAAPSLKRLFVPGTRLQPRGNKIGDFGNAASNGRRTALQYAEADGTVVTFTLKGGAGSAFLDGDRINVVLTDGGAGVSLTVRAKGGADDGRVSLGDVAVSGSLRSMNARTSDVSGTLFASGSIGMMSVGTLAGTVAAAGGIGTLRAAALTDAKVLSGASLGADGRLGGTGADADTFRAGSIGAVRVSGAIDNSLIAAGLDPVDASFFNDDDRITGGADSVIRWISAASADDRTRLVAGAFGRARLGDAADPATDPRFTTL